MLMFEHLADLSLDALRVFESAARLRSFTAAAVELGTTQPAVSQQMKRLEAQLGTRLFDRIYRGIELTEAGLLLFEQVHQGLQAMDDGVAQASGRGQREVLQVATDFAFAAFWLMPRLQRFHDAYPQVDVSLVTGERSQGCCARTSMWRCCLVMGVSIRARVAGCSMRRSSRSAAHG